MKVKTVSALRSKRGLHRMNGAEPPVVARTPQTTDIWKTDAMTPYILRQPKPVEPEKSGGDSAPTARPQKTGARVGSRLRLEWIADGFTDRVSGPGRGVGSRPWKVS